MPWNTASFLKGCQLPLEVLLLVHLCTETLREVAGATLLLSSIWCTASFPNCNDPLSPEFALAKDVALNHSLLLRVSL